MFRTARRLLEKGVMKMNNRKGKIVRMEKKSIEKAYDRLHEIEEKLGKESIEAQAVRDEIEHIELMDEMFSAAI